MMLRTLSTVAILLCLLGCDGAINPAPASLTVEDTTTGGIVWVVSVDGQPVGDVWEGGASQWPVTAPANHVVHVVSAAGDEAVHMAGWTDGQARTFQIQPGPVLTIVP